MCVCIFMCSLILFHRNTLNQRNDEKIKCIALQQQPRKNGSHHSQRSLFRCLFIILAARWSSFHRIKSIFSSLRFYHIVRSAKDDIRWARCINSTWFKCTNNLLIKFASGHCCEKNNNQLLWVFEAQNGERNEPQFYSWMPKQWNSNAALNIM